jgi:excisionase family DNA binding protein
MIVPPQDQLLTSGEVARILHLNVNTIRRWCDRGILKHYRIGTRGDRRIPLAFVDSIISQMHIRITELIPNLDSIVPSYLYKDRNN